MDYYSILGVSKNASEQDIRKAYKKQSMQHHPDRGGNEEQFKKVNEAYSTLKDPQKRAAYDNPHNADPFRNQQQRQSPFGGHPFEHMFGKGFGPTRHAPRNRDITVQARIDLKDVLTGKNLIIQYQLSTGRLETVTVEVPAGAKHGDKIQYEGLGDEGNPRIPRGHLQVRIVVDKLKNWERDNDNLIVKKTVNVFDLLLGCVIIITTLDNKKLEIKIPQGTQTGTTFSIPKYGVPNMRSGQRGNLYVTIDTVIPKITDKALLSKIEHIKKEL